MSFVKIIKKTKITLPLGKYYEVVMWFEEIIVNRLGTGL